MEDLNACGEEEFLSRVGGIFEHSPWIARAVCAARPFASAGKLLDAMAEAVRASGEEAQLALIQAHPDLAGRLARQGQLTAESTKEQGAAGLSQADEAAISRINELNAAYQTRFGFPFIICARLNNVETIISAMERRLHNDAAGEKQTALEEIYKIARLRLADIVEG